MQWTHAPDAIPDGTDLYRQVQKGNAHSSASSDGWKLGELKGLPQIAWKSRHRVLKVSCRIGRFPTPSDKSMRQAFRRR